MLLPPNHTNKSFSGNKKKKVKKTSVKQKVLPYKLVKLARKLQEAVDRLSSSSEKSDNQNDENDGY